MTQTTNYQRCDRCKRNVLLMDDGAVALHECDAMPDIDKAVRMVRTFGETDTQAFRSERQAMLDLCAHVEATR